MQKAWCLCLLLHLIKKLLKQKCLEKICIEIKLVGDTFDDCAVAAKKYTEANGLTFIPPFDDYKIIEGQGTVAVEILEDRTLILIIYLYRLAAVG